MEDVNDKVFDFTADLVKDYDPLAVAAILVIQGMSLYRTILSADEYDRIVDLIQDRKHEVKVYHSRLLQ